MATRTAVTIEQDQTITGQKTIDKVILTNPHDLAENVVTIDKYSSFENAIDTIGSTVTTLIIHKATTVTANRTVPNTLALRFSGQGSLSVNSGITLTVNGRIISNRIRSDVLIGAGTITLTGAVLFPGQQRYRCGRLSNLGVSDPFSQCHIVPYNGNLILINGVPEVIPNGNLTTEGGVIATYASTSIDKVTGQSLAINTFYRIYLYMLNGVMTMDFSTTAQALDATTGTWIKSGDSTSAFIGILRTDANVETRGSGGAQTIASFFNKVRFYLITGVDGSTTSNTAVELNSANRLEWVQFSDDIPHIHAIANVGNSVSGNRVNVGIGLDGTVITGTTAVAQVHSTLIPSVNMSVQTNNPGGEVYIFATFLAFETEDSGAGNLSLAGGAMWADQVPS